MNKEIEEFFEAHKEYYDSHPIYRDILKVVGGRKISMKDLSIALCRQGHLNADKEYEDNNMRLAVWHLVGQNILHFTEDYEVRFKRKSDYFVG